MKLHNPFARHTGRHVPRTIPGTMLQPVSFNDEPEDDWGEPDEDDGRCVHCGADTGHYNGCTEDPGAMCLCHLCMGDQAVTSEAECPYHGASGAPERPSWWERVSGGASALIDGCARGLAWLIDGPEEVMPDEPVLQRGSGTLVDVPRPGDSAGRSAEAPGLATMPGVQPGPGHHQPPETQVLGAVKVGDTYLAQTGTPIGPWCTCIIGSDEGRARTGVQDCPVHGTLPPEDDGDRTEQMGAIRFAGHHQARNIWGPPAPETRWDYIARTGIPESLAYVAEILAAPLPRVKALTA